MLDRNDPWQELVDQFGPMICDVELPESWDDFFDRTGQISCLATDKRRFPRHYLRIPAALRYRQSLPALPRAKVWYKVYAKDVSRCGLSFVHGEQLFPGEQMMIALPATGQCEIEIARCAQVQRQCFEIGVRFIKGFRSRDV